MLAICLGLSALTSVWVGYAAIIFLLIYTFSNDLLIWRAVAQ